MQRVIVRIVKRRGRREEREEANEADDEEKMERSHGVIGKRKILLVLCTYEKAMAIAWWWSGGVGVG